MPQSTSMLFVPGNSLEAYRRGEISWLDFILENRSYEFCDGYRWQSVVSSGRVSQQGQSFHKLF